MGALSEVLGENVTFNDDEECFLEFDGGIDMVVMLVPESPFLSLCSAITETGQALPPALLQEALLLNYSSMPPGFTIGQSEIGAPLHLLLLVDAGHEEPEHFISLVAGFLEIVPGLRERYQSLVANHAELAQ